MFLVDLLVGMDPKSEEGETHRGLVPPEEVDGRLCPPSKDLKSILRKPSREPEASPSKKVKWTKETDRQFKAKVKQQKKDRKKLRELAKRNLDSFTVSNWTLRMNNTKMQLDF